MATTFKNINQFFNAGTYTDGETVATGNSLVYNAPPGVCRIRIGLSCAGGATGYMDYTLDDVTDATTADAAIWYNYSGLSANTGQIVAVDFPVKAVRFRVATAGTGACTIYAERIRN